MALQLLAYLKHAQVCDLLYSQHGRLQCETYSDLIYASDHGDPKSTYGFFIYDGDNLVTLQSNRERVVSLSRIETEYRAMT